MKKNSLVSVLLIFGSITVLISFFLDFVNVDGQISLSGYNILLLNFDLPLSIAKKPGYLPFNPVIFISKWILLSIIVVSFNIIIAIKIFLSNEGIVDQDIFRSFILSCLLFLCWSLMIFDLPSHFQGMAFDLMFGHVILFFTSLYLLILTGTLNILQKYEVSS